MAESRIYTVICTVETAEGLTVGTFNYENKNDAMAKWHHECEYDRSSDAVISFTNRVENELGSVEALDAFKR